MSQSALEPAGPAAAAIRDLTGVLAGGAGLVFLLVMAVLILAVAREPQPVRTGLWVVGGGIVFPTIALSTLLFYSTLFSHTVTAPAPPGALRIEVIGHQWWWAVRYPDVPGEPAVTANEVHIPVGQPVDLVVASADVIHSFWVPALAGKIDMIPPRMNRLTLRADREGVYRGQCAEYCGAQHAWMALLLVAEAPATFARWLERESRPALPPPTPELERGRDAFLAVGCGGCHAIRGSGAAGRLGPDLTHVGSRRRLGAGALDNTVEHLEIWIRSGQAVKPGNRMPAYPDLDPATAHAIASYLAQLR